ncbi:hypothetical protein [Sediminibacillus massiliensis]|uniref:hypothetical protein n=1 Tax=Sediminibacillus massiliensis TaxID=1926277 RepID=UPI0009886816|nr:hypothetical protein [Sediminibacillus massiliensis]
MIEIVEGSLVESKEKMKEFQKPIQSYLSSLKKSARPKDRPKKVADMIEAEEDFLYFFRVSEMAPVQIGSIVVNYKKYEKLMKKLKRFQVFVKVEDDKLVIAYHDKNTKGRMELYDLSSKTEGMDFLPKADIRNE